MREPSCELGARRSVDRCHIPTQRRASNRHAVYRWSALGGTSLNRIKQTLTSDITFKSTRLDAFVLLLRQLGQPVGGSP
jgi:hypothetical protein